MTVPGDKPKEKATIADIETPRELATTRASQTPAALHTGAGSEHTDDDTYYGAFTNGAAPLPPDEPDIRMRARAAPNAPALEQPTDTPLLGASPRKKT